MERCFQPLPIERYLFPAVGRDPVPGPKKRYGRIAVFRRLLLFRFSDRLRNLVRGSVHILAAELLRLDKRHRLANGLDTDLRGAILHGKLFGRGGVLDERLVVDRGRISDKRFLFGRPARLCALFLAAADAVRHRRHIRLSLIKDALRHIRDRLFRQRLVLHGDVDRLFLPAAGEYAAGLLVGRRVVRRFRNGKYLRYGKLLRTLALHAAFLFRPGLFRNRLRHRLILRPRAALPFLHLLAQRNIRRNADNAEKRDDEHRKRAVYAHGPFKENGEKPGNYAAGLQIHAAVKQAADR